MTKKPRLILTVTCDNNPFDPNLKSDWGVSCFIDIGTGRKIEIQ
ncbi:MAG: hypothetical protein PVF22_01920 [Candidatus Aminicenantes bacterium]